jgi:spore coat-associated protein N
MNRFAALTRRSPRTVLAAAGTIALAGAVTAGSGANFNATTANPGNLVTAGTLAHSNSKADSAVLSADNLKPGDTATGTVDIENTGSLDGVFSLAKSNLSDTPAAASFSTKLTLTVTDLGDPTATPAPAPVQKYSGTVAGMGPVDLGTWTAGETHRYQFVITFPDGGGNGADNAYKGASTTVDYDFAAVSN